MLLSLKRMLSLRKDFDRWIIVHHFLEIAVVNTSLATNLKDCGGNYCFTENGIKDCSDCTLPHKAKNYGYIISKLSESAD